MLSRVMTLTICTSCALVFLMLNAQAADVATAPDNIIIKKHLTTVGAEHILFTIKFIEKTCDLLGTPLKGGPFNEAYVLKKLSDAETVYLSGRQKVVYKEGFSDIPPGGRNSCDLTLRPHRSVEFSSPSKNWAAYEDTDGKHRLEASDYDTRYIAMDNQRYQNRVSDYNARTGKRRPAKNILTEKHFNETCGYTEMNLKLFKYTPCYLLDSPYHVGTDYPLILHQKDRGDRLITNRDVKVDCSRTPEDIAEKEGYGAVQACFMNSAFSQVDSFEINAAMPNGIFELPDFARNLKPKTH